MESFNELVKQYEPMIWSVIHSLHIYKNQDEFFQTGLIALWEAHLRYQKGKGKFSSYAYAYIKGRMMYELTKTTKHEEHSVYPKEEFWNVLVDTKKEVALEEEMILSSFTHLTENQRKWVLYTVMHQLSVREIAELEQVSVSAVKAWRKGAREKYIGFVK